jgi:hypothetical protein
MANCRCARYALSNTNLLNRGHARPVTWLRPRPTVATVIVGARNEAQLREDLGAVGWKLTPAQVAKLDVASAVTPVYPCWHQRGFAERSPPPV